MIPKLEDCKPGLTPLGYTVLVALDTIAEKSDGGIIIPERHRNREDSASERGRIILMSAMAFKGGDWAGVDHPQVGDTVLFQRYSGTEIEGDDKKKYRIVDDKDLRGVFAPDASAASLPLLDERLLREVAA